MAWAMGIAHRVKAKDKARDEVVVVAAVRVARGWDEVKVKAKVKAKVVRAISQTEAPLRRRLPFRPALVRPVRRQAQKPCLATVPGNGACGYIVA